MRLLLVTAVGTGHWGGERRRGWEWNLKLRFNRTIILLLWKILSWLNDGMLILPEWWNAHLALDLGLLMQEDFPIGEINVTLEYCSSIWWTWLLTNHNRRCYTQDKNRDTAQTTSAIRVTMSSHSNPWWCVSLCKAWIQQFIRIWFWRLIDFTCHQSIRYY